jgi:hypothetical protein
MTGTPSTAKALGPALKTAIRGRSRSPHLPSINVLNHYKLASERTAALRPCSLL